MSRDIRITDTNRGLLAVIGAWMDQLPPDVVTALQQAARDLAKSPWKTDGWNDEPASGATVLIWAKSRLFTIRSYAGSWQTDEGTALGSEDIDRWMEVPEHDEA
jgi:hypothetical protein